MSSALYTEFVQSNYYSKITHKSCLCIKTDTKSNISTKNT